MTKILGNMRDREKETVADHLSGLNESPAVPIFDSLDPFKVSKLSFLRRNHMNQQWLFLIAYFFCTLLTVMLMHSYLSSEHNEVIAYSDFKQLVPDGKALDVKIDDRTITVGVDIIAIHVHLDKILELSRETLTA